MIEDYFISLFALSITLILSYVCLMLSVEIEKLKLMIHNSEAQSKIAFELAVNYIRRK